jgi:enterochelin esterase family protein
VGGDRWWAAVAAAGTPLWCPHGLPGGAGDGTGVPTLVFLHRQAGPGSAYLDLNGLTDRSALVAGAMTRLPGTDVHVAAFAVPPGWVGSYAVVPHDEPLVPPAPRNTPEARRWWLGVLAAARPDPWAAGGGYLDSRGSARSIASVPADATGPVAACAPSAGRAGAGPGPRTWRRPDGVEQPVWLHVPETADREVGLLVLFDGLMWAHRAPVAPVLDDLHRRGAIPPTAAVLLDAIDVDRRAADLAGGDGYLDLLADDLLPRVVAPALGERGLALHPDPRRTVVAGQSYGGLAAFRAVARRPERFGVALCQSGSFWWPEMAAPDRRAVPALLRAAGPRTARTVLQYGAYEGELTDANREVAGLLRERGEDHVVLEVPGGHDWAWWSRRLGAGLVAALA